MILSLLVAEFVLVAFVLLDRLVELKPFTERDRDSPSMWRLLACALLAICATTFQWMNGGPSWLALVSVAALSLGVAIVVRSAWVPWWRGMTSSANGKGEAHAFLEPRRPGAAVPTTFEVLTHAHAAACTLMALVVLLAPSLD